MSYMEMEQAITILSLVQLPHAYSGAKSQSCQVATSFCSVPREVHAARLPRAVS